METLTGERAADIRPARSAGAGTWDVLRLVVLVMMLGLLAAIPLTGQRESSWSELRAQVQAGTVGEVVVAGELGPEREGYAHVQVHWWDGPVRRYVVVAQVGGPDGGGSPGMAIFHRPPSEVLRELDPGLLVVPGEHRSTSGHAFGWHLSPALLYLLVVSWALGMILLVTSPLTWRASPWAWFWVLLLGLPGAVAFLMLSGPTPLVPATRDPHRRISGGWTFLLLVVATAVWRRT